MKRVDYFCLYFISLFIVFWFNIKCPSTVPCTTFFVKCDLLKTLQQYKNVILEPFVCCLLLGTLTTEPAQAVGAYCRHRRSNSFSLITNSFTYGWPLDESLSWLK